MRHNLFTHPTEAVVTFDENGNYKLENLIEAQNLMDVLGGMDYNINLIDKQLKYMIEESPLLTRSKKRDFLGKLYLFLVENWLS